jgi:hypothetical protein
MLSNQQVYVLGYNRAAIAGVAAIADYAGKCVGDDLNLGGGELD